MCTTFPPDDDRIQKLSVRIRTVSMEDATHEIHSSLPNECKVIVDIQNRKVIDSHLFDFVFNLSKLTFPKLHDIILNDFYRCQVKCYCHAASNILVNIQESLAFGTRFEITFPSKIEIRNPFGFIEKTLIYQVSEPIILILPNGEQTFASIDTYRMVGAYHSDYFPIRPYIKKGGVLLQEETRKMVESARLYIYEHLKIFFTFKEIDVLELLSKGKDSREIARQFKITFETVETHRKHIRNKVKILFPDLNDIKMANKILQMGLF